MQPLLTIEQVPAPLANGTFKGRVRLPVHGNTDTTVAIVPFMWAETESADGWPPGWKPSTSQPVGVGVNGEWIAEVPAARQHAATLVMTGFNNPVANWSAEDRGALPTFPVAYIVAAEEKVVIISAPYLALTGLVTGFANALRLAPAGQITVVAWTRKAGVPALIGEAVLAPSGAWSFPNLTPEQREADEYAVALIRTSFHPGDNVPLVGGDVLDLQWQIHTPHPPMTRASGGGSSPP